MPIRQPIIMAIGRINIAIFAPGSVTVPGSGSGSKVQGLGINLLMIMILALTVIQIGTVLHGSVTRVLRMRSSRILIAVRQCRSAISAAIRIDHDGRRAGPGPGYVVLVYVTFRSMTVKFKLELHSDSSLNL